MKLKILVVDDSMVVRGRIQKVLERISYVETTHIKRPFKVLTADNGKSGLSIFQKEHNDIGLIFSDIEMPEMGGVEMVTAIRLTGSKVPIVMCSGAGNRDNVVACAKQGVTDFIAKPFPNWRIEDSLLKNMGMHRSQIYVERPMELVLLEPNQQAAILMNHILVGKGYEVQRATDGGLAAKFLITHPSSRLLVNVDEVPLDEVIKAREAFERVTNGGKLGVLGYSMTGNFSNLIEAEIKLILKSPFSIDVLFDTIEAL